MFYRFEKNDSQSNKLLENNKYFIHSLIPNNITIFSLTGMDEGIKNYIRYNYANMKYLIFPLYKHLWKDSGLVLINDDPNGENIVYCTHIKNKPTNYIDFNFKSFLTNEINDFFIQNNFSFKEKFVKYKVYTFTYETYAFLLTQIQTITDNNITFEYILGIVEGCIKIGIVSVPFFQDIRKKSSFSFAFSVNRLKSLNISNQLKIFEYWKNKENFVLTGGTGVGKTTQVPKILWWINYLYDGFDDLDFNNFSFNINKIELVKRMTVLSLARKLLITETCQNILNSLGIKNINDGPFNCIFKNVTNTNYHNKNINSYLSPLIIAITRKTPLHNINTIIFDEIHEHDTFGDIFITISKKLKEMGLIRNIVLITATIEDDRDNINRFFNNNIEYLHIAGDTLYPIEEVDESHITNVLSNYRNINLIINKYSKIKGYATLIFLPTFNQILEVEKNLNETLNLELYKIIKLNRNIIKDEIDIIKQIESYKDYFIIVLTTPISESSITIANAKTVIDSGLFYTNIFFNGLTMNITKSMMIQRKGRVGRTSSGVYVKLFKKKDINESFLKIDYNFIFPYVIIYNHFKIDFLTESYIVPTDINRITNVKKYLNRIGVNIEKFGFQIYKIFNIYKLEYLEYLPIYIFGTKKEKSVLDIFENIDSLKEKIIFIKKNQEIFYSIITQINLPVLILSMLKKDKISENFYRNENIYIKNVKVSIPNYYEDVKTFRTHLLSLYDFKKTFFLSKDLIIS